jgi:hypothetical protein
MVWGYIISRFFCWRFFWTIENNNGLNTVVFQVNSDRNYLVSFWISIVQKNPAKITTNNLKPLKFYENPIKLLGLSRNVYRGNALTVSRPWVWDYKSWFRPDSRGRFISFPFGNSLWKNVHRPLKKQIARNEFQ